MYHLYANDKSSGANSKNSMLLLNDNGNHNVFVTINNSNLVCRLHKLMDNEPMIRKLLSPVITS